HTTTGCGEQGFPSAQPYLSHTPGANPFCCMYSSFSFLLFIIHGWFMSAVGFNCVVVTTVDLFYTRPTASPAGDSIHPA
ncbi:uncharacterized protein BO80DRAFT_364297, partial [Aspergillus ibericus CBS 121593]